MRDDEPLALRPDACVTASDLVRQFGLWQERAIQQPVFVMRRGRPSLVLTSIDLMRRLCSPNPQTGNDTLEALLLDTMVEPVFLIDGDARVQRMNRAARMAFGRPTGAEMLSAILPDAAARFLAELAARARRAGATRNTELAVGDRRYRFAVVPMDGGAALIADDCTSEDDAVNATARFAAIVQAADMLDDLAWARVTSRGYVEAASAALGRMAGIEQAVLQSVRFVTLLVSENRRSVADAIDSVVSDGTPRRMIVALNCRSGGERSMRLALAPERAGAGVSCVTALLAPAPP